MKILMGPQGRLIKGHVLDVNEKRFNEALRFYDPQLYTRWNPNKLRGHGCWEIRRKPEFNSALDVTEYEGNLIFRVGPKEYDLVHHVLDCAFLNYDALRKLREMDCWQYGSASDYQDEVERRTRDRREREREAALKERAALTHYYRKEIRAFREAIRDGMNPHLIAKYWDSVTAAD
jgi:hypothetical protein